MTGPNGGTGRVNPSRWIRRSCARSYTRRGGTRRASEAHAPAAMSLGERKARRDARKLRIAEPRPAAHHRRVALRTVPIVGPLPGVACSSGSQSPARAARSISRATASPEAERTGIARAPTACSRTSSGATVLLRRHPRSGRPSGARSPSPANGSRAVSRRPTELRRVERAGDRVLRAQLPGRVEATATTWEIPSRRPSCSRYPGARMEPSKTGGSGTYGEADGTRTYNLRP